MKREKTTSDQQMTAGTELAWKKVVIMAGVLQRVTLDRYIHGASIQEMWIGIPEHLYRVSPIHHPFERTGDFFQMREMRVGAEAHECSFHASHPR